MSPEDLSAREKILKVATQLLYKNSPEIITTRQIASAAGVNVAAVNYYFQTKEKLIDEAIFAATRTFFESGLAVLKNKEIAPVARIGTFFKGYAKGLVEFMGFTRTAFMGFLQKNGRSERYYEFLRDLSNAVVEVLGEIGPDWDLRTRKDRATALFAGVIFPFLFMDGLKGTDATNYRDPAERNRYIEFLVTKFGS